jgi:hypothetical protein
MGMIPPILLELRAKGGEVHAELKAVTAETKHMVAETETGATKMGAAYKGAAGAGKALLLGVAGAAVAVGGFSIEAASAAQVVDARLAVAVKNAGGNMEEMEPKVKSLDGAMRNYGFSNEDTNGALATLTTSLKDPAQAMKVMSVAADLAKAKNIDLNSAALMVAKGMEGQTRPLKALGIDLPVYAGNAQAVKLAQIAMSTAQDNVNKILAKTPDAANSASKAHGTYEKAMRTAALAQEKLTQTQSSGAQILKTLSERVKGSAAAFGDTLKGKLDAAKAGLQNIGETIGKQLIPIILKVITGAQNVAKWFGQNKDVAIALGVVLGSIAAILIGVYVAQKLVAVGMAIGKAATIGWTAAQWLMNAAMDANPIGIIVLAIVALIAIIILIATKTTFFQDIWKNSVAVIGAAWNWLWNSVIKPVGEFIGNAIGIIGSVVGKVFGAIGGVIKGAFDGVVGFVRSIFNTVIDIINGIIGAINTVLAAGKVIGINVQLPKLPHFDVGTDRVPGSPGEPMQAVIHGGEAILSNDMLAGHAPIPPRVTDAVNAQQGGGSTSASSKQVTNNVTVHAVTNASPRQIATTASWEIRRLG